MKRLAFALCACLMLLGLGALPALAASGGGTNAGNAVKLPWPSQEFSQNPSGTVDSVSRPDDVYRVYVEEGGRMDFFLTPAVSDSHLTLRIFSGDVADITHAAPLYSQTCVGSNPATIDLAPSQGAYFYVDVNASTGGGAYTMPYQWHASPNANLQVMGVTAPALTSSPMFGFLDPNWDWSDASSVFLHGGDTLTLSLDEVAPNPASAVDPMFGPVLYMYGPGSTSTTDAPIWASAASTSPFPHSFTAPSDGTYFVDVYDAGTGAGWTRLTWSVTPVRIGIKRSPAAAKLSYKKGKKFTLSATFADQFNLPLRSYSVILQTSSNNKKWKNTYGLSTNAAGQASRKITAKKKGVTYYRWARLASSTNTATYSGSQKVTIK